MDTDVPAINNNFDPRESNKCTPDYWFLGDAVPPYSRDRTTQWTTAYGNSSTYTSGNLVTPLIDGATYMPDLYNELVSMTIGDYLYMVGWQFTPEQYLLDRDARVPNPDDSDTTGTAPLLIDAPRLVNLLETAIGNGADVRVMAFWPTTLLASWRSTLSARYVCKEKMTDSVNAINAAKGKAVLDSKLARGYFIPRSHHQKALVLRIGGRYLAYVGGIDLGSDRWDTPAHKKNYKDFNFYGWHDIQCRIEGDAVQQVWANFHRPLE